MKTTNFIILLVAAVILFHSCNKSQKNKLPIVNINGREIANLNLLELKDTTYVKLSQIAKNLRVVALETNQDCLISGDIFFDLGNQYIIAHDISGAYQFSMDGTFIRKLYIHGGGPGEIPQTFPDCYLVEDEDLFLAATRDHIYQYQLSSGRFLGTNGKPVLRPREQMNTFKYVRDSLILFSYFNVGTPKNDFPEDSLDCGIKLQELNGKVLWQKKFDYSSWSIHPVMKIGLLTGSNTYILSTNNADEFVIQISDHDTVYKLNTTTYSLYPSLLRESEIQNKDGFPIDRLVANCFIENNEYACANGYQLMRFEYVTNEPVGWDYNVELYYILYDANIKRAFRIGTFENDYLGFVHNTV